MGESKPTKELRARLDELAVEWWPSDDPCCEDVITHWCVGPFQWTAIEGEKDLWLNAGIAGHEPLTPEQAIAATVGNAREPSNAVIERIERFCTDYAQCLVDSTAYGKRNHERIDRRALEQAEGIEADLIRKLAADIATAGAGTCHIIKDEDTDYLMCSECGAIQPDEYTMYHCWYCGRKIKVSE